MPGISRFTIRVNITISCGILQSIDPRIVCLWQDAGDIRSIMIQECLYYDFYSGVKRLRLRLSSSISTISGKGVG